MKKFAEVLKECQFLNIQQHNDLLRITLQNYENYPNETQNCVLKLAQLLLDEKVVLEIISYHLDKLPNVAVLGNNIVELAIQAPIHVLPEYMFTWENCIKVEIWSSSIKQFTHFENLPINTQNLQLRVRIFDCSKFNRKITKVIVIAEQICNRKKCDSTIQIFRNN